MAGLRNSNIRARIPGADRSFRIPDLYVATYLVPLPTERRLPTTATAEMAAFYAATQSVEFPYDIGDDPSFFAARYHNGPVTWGVCRHDVRAAVQPGDWVVLLSAQRDGLNSTCKHYKLVAALCVESKISHPEIFAGSADCLYRAYLNLLIRPRGSGWEHYEPSLAAWHGDWLWRISLPSGLRKRDFVEAGRLHAPGDPLTIQGRPLPVAENYVIFSRSSAILVPNPPLVAIHEGGYGSEAWQTDAQSKRIRELLFGSSLRGLRTGNRQQPHRHFRRCLDDLAWPTLLREVLI
jgi:hypothetical protein